METIERDEYNYRFNEAAKYVRYYKKQMEVSLREYIRAVCEAKQVEQIDFNVNTDYPRFRNKALNIKGNILAVKAHNGRIQCLTGREWRPYGELSDVRLDEIMDSVREYDKRNDDK